MQTEPTRKVEKKEKKKRRLWTTDANRLQITVNLKNMRHLRRAFQRFCASSHPSYKCYMLENLAFFHNSSKTPDDADIANRKHYSAPAGALTMFLGAKTSNLCFSLVASIIGGTTFDGQATNRPPSLESRTSVSRCRPLSTGVRGQNSCKG